MKKRKNRRADLLRWFLLFLAVGVFLGAILLICRALEALDSPLRQILSAAVVLLAAGGAATAAYLITKRMSEQPVRQILEATEKLSAGDYSVRIAPAHPKSAYTTLDVIIVNINTMAAELQKKETLNNDFLSNLSHELKTPLAVIRSYAALLLRGDLTEEKRGEYLETLLASTRKLTDLVTNILRLSKLEASETRPQVETVNLTEMLENAVLGFESVIERKNISVECDLEPVVCVSCPSYLEIIWNNLLSNALKFTQENGSVFVTLRADGEDCVVSVRDTGCGMTEETGNRIFEKFYQGDTSHAREGNGLGLALVKKIIDILGGSICVESEPGKGSTFSVRIRRSA